MTTVIDIGRTRQSVCAETALAAQLTFEDYAEDAVRLAPDDRITCPLHRKWIHQCVASPTHVNRVTSHRWCRHCALPLAVAIDEVALTVTMRCPGCGGGNSPATARVLTACRTSLARSKVRAASACQ
jgi:hypothetical protein